MKIKAVFFDLDDTLYDHLAPFSRALKRAFPEIPEIDTAAAYKKFRSASDQLWSEHMKEPDALEKMRLGRIILAMKGMGHEICEEKARYFQELYDSELGTISLFPEAAGILREIRQRGYLTGIISNGPAAHQAAKIDRLGLDEIVPKEMIFLPESFGLAKPDPEVFRYVSRQTGLKGDELIYIGDSWENDVAAPLEAGWKAVWFNHRARKRGSGEASAEITELAELLDLLNGQGY